MILHLYGAELVNADTNVYSVVCHFNMRLSYICAVLACDGKKCSALLAYIELLCV